MENLRIQTPSGKSLAATLHGSAKPGMNLAILCPGYLDTKDYAHLVMLSEDLCNRGYDVLRFDPVGTWGSDGGIEEYTTTEYLADIKSVVEYMLSKHPYSHILLGGHSRGGQMSVLYAARDPRISQVVAIMPSSPLVFDKTRDEKWEAEGISVSKRDIPSGGEREYRVPYSHNIDRKQYNVLQEVKKVRVPIIFIAGEKDVLVLPEYVKALYDEANEPKKYILVENIGHDYRHSPDEIREVNNLIIKEIA